MKLYHFTSPVHIKGCLKEGITKGSIPLIIQGKIALATGWQWLTSNPEFKQEWTNGEYSTLPYDRTAFRLTVNIPKTAKDKLFRWMDVCKKLPIIKEMNDFGDPENWWVFKGRIKPSWIKKVEGKSCKEESRLENTGTD